MNGVTLYSLLKSCGDPFFGNTEYGIPNKIEGVSRSIMKKQTQLKLAPFFGIFGMADGRKIHGLGTFRPAPVVVNE